MNDLVIQGPRLTPDDLQTLRQDTGADAVHAPRPGMARLRNVSERGPVAPFCAARSLDFTFLDRPLRLADFRLVAMDMDSTLITIECIDEIADMIGVKPQVAAITAAAMRGELDFPSALRQRVRLLAGLEENALQRVYDERLRLSPGAENLLAAAQSAGLKTLLVSGGFTFFTERLQRRLNLDATLANTLEVRDGKLTGQVLGAIVDADAKAAKVREVCAQIGCEPRQAIVLGDGANDLKMMALAGLSVAFRAKPVVQQQAHVALNHVGLDGVLNLLD
ncbi:MAG TPA: phosphoserine phosphatase SerB [Candidatus Limnocylindria bacterium]|jgi:phosphoserine phosphatase|nr:phosphoserine phosphatase SerB [Candidatus Limnocylindria bacterium]